MDSLTLWILAGMGLLVSEMLSGGFFLMFLAFGSFAAALAASLGASMSVQMAACAVISIGGVLTLRKPIQKRLMKTLKIETDIGAQIRVDQAIAPHQQARITYQGTSWLATNLGAHPLKEGDHATIVGIDGNILLIRKID